MSFFQALVAGAEAEGMRPGYILRNIVFKIYLHSKNHANDFVEYYKEGERMYLPYWWNDRTRGEKAGFLLESLRGMGIVPAEKKEKTTDEQLAKRQVEAKCSYVDFLKTAFDSTGDAALAATLRFLNRTDLSDLFKQTAGVNKYKGTTFTHYVVWLYDGTYIHERPVVAQYGKLRPWDEDASLDNNELLCLVSGKPTKQLLIKQPKIGKSRMSSLDKNKTAFQHWGFSGIENAPIDFDVGLQCCNFIQRLITKDVPHPTERKVLPRRSVFTGEGNSICFWSTTKVDDLIDEICYDVFGGYASNDSDNKVEQEHDPGSVDEVGVLYRSPYRHKRANRTRLPRSNFYVAALNLGQERMALTYWHESSVQDVADNIDQYFSDLEIMTSKGPRAYSIPALLKWTLPVARQKNWRKFIAQDVFRQFTAAALQGSALPHGVFTKLLERCKRETKTGKDALCIPTSFFKAYINRRIRLGALDVHNIKEITMQLDETNESTAYLLGRLMAWLCSLASSAYGNSKNSFYARYYKSMGTTPKRVFGSVLSCQPAYYSKLERGGKGRFVNGYYKPNIETLAARLLSSPNFLPDMLTQTEQAVYHCAFALQNTVLYTKKPAKSDKETDVDTTDSTQEVHDA